MDDSGFEISCTLWGDQARHPENLFEGYPVLAIKSLKVGDYCGVSLGSINGTQISKNPTDLKEAIALKAWWGGGSPFSFALLP